MTAPAGYPGIPGPEHRRPRGAKVLMIAGGILLLLALIAVPVGYRRAEGNIGQLANGKEQIRESLDVEVAVPGRAEVHLDSGIHYVYAFGTFWSTEASNRYDETGSTPENSNYRPPLAAQVTISDPAGKEVPLDLPGIGSMFEGLGEVYVYREFSVSTPGTYIVRTTEVSRDDLELDPVTSIGVGPPVGAMGHIKQAVGGGLLVLGGLSLGALGFFLFLGGLIWWTAGGRTGPAQVPPGPWGAPPAWGTVDPWGRPIPGPPAPPQPAGPWTPPPAPPPPSPEPPSSWPPDG